MDYRIDKEGLFAKLGDWNAFLKRKVRLVACGGTALTLLGIKPSTKDIDLMVPDEENIFTQQNFWSHRSKKGIIRWCGNSITYIWEFSIVMTFS